MAVPAVSVLTYINDRNYDLDRLDYGNGDSVQYEYDDKGRVTSQTYEDGDTVTYTYDNDGNLAAVTDSATGITTTYYYDLIDRLSEYTQNGGTYDVIVGYRYDEKNNIDYIAETINGEWRGTYYTFDDDNRVTRVYKGSGARTYRYDNFGRLVRKAGQYDGSDMLAETYTYTNPTTSTTSGQVATHSISASGLNKFFRYTYDDNGNILSIADGTYTITYAYDTANQLIRENNPIAGKTWTWTYDDAGNIRSRKEYAYNTGTLGTPTDTVTYTYGDSDWGDLLTGYDGKTITYDTIGNPLTDGTWTYTWEHGRQLASMRKSGTAWYYLYDADGLRTQRTNGSTTYNYAYVDGQLVKMTRGGTELAFAYDAEGRPLTVRYNDLYYFYVTNLQGDVIAIVHPNGTQVVSYTYDAWGNILSMSGTMASTLGTLNPLRYRSYVYDTETGLYYLQSRYYNPEMGRFINADDGFYSEGESNPISFNLFAYCLNNPVNRTDATGNWSIWATVGLVVGAAICIAAVTVLTCGVGTATLAGAVAVGAAKGALIGAAVGTTVGAGIGYAATGTVEGALEGAAFGFGAGAVVGAVAGAKAGANSWYNSMAQEFTNAGSSEVVLGRSGTYEAVAQSRGSTYFHTSDARWTEVHDMFGVGDRGMWNINKAFLNQQISAGNTFALANNPATSGGYYFLKEVAYLTSKGISMLPIF